MYFDRYELSQDLLDKQIEMLERKYGGVKARNAALTIQRAFRRYTLLKKFAAITAMAKAEKRMSRKLQEAVDRQQQEQHLPAYHHHHHHHHTSQIYVQAQPHQQQVQHHQSSPVNRATPIRSMSLRERRQGGIVHVDGSQLGCSSPIPRNQTGRCEIQISSSPHQQVIIRAMALKKSRSVCNSFCTRVASEFTRSSERARTLI